LISKYSDQNESLKVFNSFLILKIRDILYFESNKKKQTDDFIKQIDELTKNFSEKSVKTFANYLYFKIFIKKDIRKIRNHMICL